MSDRELEVFAVFVHGALASLHAIGFIYNAKRGRGNRLDAAAHLFACGYDLAATVRHVRRLSLAGSRR